jgi:hypothetical protein
MDEKLTKFENDLRDFFPDIFKLHMYSKADKFLWEAVYALMDMRDKDQTGEVNIRYNAGKIERIIKAVNMTAYEASKAYLDK